MTLAPPSTGPMAGMSPRPGPFQSRPMTTTIHLSGPADVLTVLPYQLGFHPHRCLVVVSLHGTRMGLVQRIDLPPPDHVGDAVAALSLIHISEPTRRTPISYAVFCLK